MKVIGVDPGLDGALVCVSTAGTGGAIASWLDMPTIAIRGKRRVNPAAIVAWLRELDAVERIVLEEVGGLPRMGATSAFTFGQGFGILQGIFAAGTTPWSTVTPQRWTKALGLGADKGEHRQAAIRLYSGFGDLFARVKDDGRADAALIAEYALRNPLAVAA